MKFVGFAINFSEINTAFNDAKLHSENKLNLKTHAIATPFRLNISPKQIINLCEKFNLPRGVFSKYLHTSSRTLRIGGRGEASLMFKTSHC
jgi:putative transcriptional regulator